MKKIFRSIINVKKDGKPTVEQIDLKRNYKAFIGSRVEPEDPSYIKLYHWIEAHYREYNEIPSIEYLFERAKKDGEESVLASLIEVAKERPYVSSDYLAILKEKFEEQNKQKFSSVLQKTWQVADSGLTVGKGKNKREIKGINSALEYFASHSRNYRSSVYKNKTESSIRTTQDADEVLSSYENRKMNKYDTLGMYTFLDRIDATCRGLKAGQLMLIAGYTGQGKSILSANFAYNGIMQGLNGLFVAMEMPFEEMRDIFYTLHTSNTEWLEHPKYKNMCGKIPVEKVQYGELNDLEEEFFKEAAADFKSNESGYGELIIYQPPEKLTPSLLETVMYDYHSSLQERGTGLDFVVLDYVGLMVADKSERYGDWNVDLNNIVKKLKNTCLTFDDGRKIRIISPFQVNREGWKEATKNEGVYRLSALSNANEAERASDLVVSVFMSDEMKKAGMIKICCLKHRQGGIFSPFEARADLPTRHIRDFEIAKKDDENTDELIQNLPMDVK